MSEEKEEVTSSSPKLKKMKTPVPSWIRPMTGLFAIFAGVIYAVASCLFAFIYFGVIRKFAPFTEGDKEEYIAELVEKGQEIVPATSFVDSSVSNAQMVSEHVGLLFAVFLSLFACISMLMAVSGFGLLTKKAWSLSLGRLSYVSMLASVAAFFLIHHSGFSAIYSGLLEAKMIEGEGTYGLLSSLRLVFLFSMCPAALLMANNLITKQLQPDQD